MVVNPLLPIGMWALSFGTLLQRAGVVFVGVLTTFAVSAIVTFTCIRLARISVWLLVVPLLIATGWTIFVTRF